MPLFRSRCPTLRQNARAVLLLKYKHAHTGQRSGLNKNRRRFCIIDYLCYMGGRAADALISSF